MINHGYNKNKNKPKQLFLKNILTKIYISHTSRHKMEK